MSKIKVLYFCENSSEVNLVNSKMEVIVVDDLIQLGKEMKSNLDILVVSSSVNFSIAAIKQYMKSCEINFPVALEGVENFQMCREADVKLEKTIDDNLFIDEIKEILTDKEGKDETVKNNEASH